MTSEVVPDPSIRRLGSILLTVLAACDGFPSADDAFPVPHPDVDGTAPEAPFAAGQKRDVADADAVLRLPRPSGSEIGDEISGVLMPGDLDGDGVDDLVVWSLMHGDSELVDCAQGCPAFQRISVRIVYGGGQELSLHGGPRLVGPWTNGLRAWVASAGDLDGDGDAELLISVGGDCQQGSVYVVRGGARRSGLSDLRASGELIRESGACTGFGHAQGIDDLDGDGRSEFAVTRLSSLHTYVFRGGAPSPERRSEMDADLAVLDRGGAHYAGRRRQRRRPA